MQQQSTLDGYYTLYDKLIRDRSLQHDQSACFSGSYTSMQIEVLHLLQEQCVVFIKTKDIKEPPEMKNHENKFQFIFGLIDHPLFAEKHIRCGAKRVHKTNLFQAIHQKIDQLENIDDCKFFYELFAKTSFFSLVSANIAQRCCAAHPNLIEKNKMIEQLQKRICKLLEAEKITLTPDRLYLSCKQLVDHPIFQNTKSKSYQELTALLESMEPYLTKKINNLSL